MRQSPLNNRPILPNIPFYTSTKLDNLEKPKRKTVQTPKHYENPRGVRRLLIIFRPISHNYDIVAIRVVTVFVLVVLSMLFYFKQSGAITTLGPLPDEVINEMGTKKGHKVLKNMKNQLHEKIIF